MLHLISSIITRPGREPPFRHDPPSASDLPIPTHLRTMPLHIRVNDSDTREEKNSSHLLAGWLLRYEFTINFAQVQWAKIKQRSTECYQLHFEFVYLSGWRRWMSKGEGEVWGGQVESQSNQSTIEIRAHFKSFAVSVISQLRFPYVLAVDSTLNRHHNRIALWFICTWW